MGYEELKRTNKSIGAQALGLIPKDAVWESIRKHGADFGVKGFSSYSFFNTMLFSQFTRCSSLRELAGAVATSPKAFREQFIPNPPRRTTLSDALRIRSWLVFKDAFDALLAFLSSVLLPDSSRFTFNNNLYALDSTIVSLCLALYPWATYRAAKGGVKVHTLYNVRTAMPSFVLLTDARTHDVLLAREMPLLASDIVVGDRGYIDYRLFYTWDKQGVFFVTKAKKTMSYTVLVNDFVPEPPSPGGISPQAINAANNMAKGLKDPFQVISDQTIELTGPKARHDCPIPLRLVTARDPLSGEEFGFLTNNRKLSAHTIAMVYRARWDIERFFRFLKQNLVIDTFLGTSENAVLIQIYSALIATLIITFLKEKAAVDWDFSNLVSLLNLNWFSYYDLTYFMDQPLFEQKPRIQTPPDQLFERTPLFRTGEVLRRSRVHAPAPSGGLQAPVDAAGAHEPPAEPVPQAPVDAAGAHEPAAEPVPQAPVDAAGAHEPPAEAGGDELATVAVRTHEQPADAGADEPSSADGAQDTPPRDS
jgi:hypothetical protein